MQTKQQIKQNEAGVYCVPRFFDGQMIYCCRDTIIDSRKQDRVRVYCIRYTLLASFLRIIASFQQ